MLIMIGYTQWLSLATGNYLVYIHHLSVNSAWDTDSDIAWDTDSDIAWDTDSGTCTVTLFGYAISTI